MTITIKFPTQFLFLKPQEGYLQHLYNLSDPELKDQVNDCQPKTPFRSLRG